MVVRNADGSTVAVAECTSQSPDPGLVDLINLFGPPTDAHRLASWTKSSSREWWRLDSA